jgi:hypothetical protein
MTHPTDTPRCDPVLAPTDRPLHHYTLPADRAAAAHRYLDTVRWANLLVIDHTRDLKAIDLYFRYSDATGEFLPRRAPARTPRPPHPDAPATPTRGQATDRAGNPHPMPTHRLPYRYVLNPDAPADRQQAYVFGEDDTDTPESDDDDSEPESDPHTTTPPTQPTTPAAATPTAQNSEIQDIDKQADTADHHTEDTQQTTENTGFEPQTDDAAGSVVETTTDGQNTEQQIVEQQSNTAATAHTLAENTLFDSSLHPKQRAFVETVWGAAHRHNPYRQLLYGGGIRGGKTFACLAAAVLIALEFPGARIHIVRRTLQTLESATWPSLRKLLPPDGLHTLRKASSEWTLTLRNGSQICLFSECADSDPDLDRFKGLETNVVVLEQVEELQAATFDKALERAGSWHLRAGPAPPPLVLATFNPAHNWVKRRFHEPAALGTLPPDTYFLPALPADSPFVTPDQFDNWLRLDTLFYRRFVQGDWHARDATGRFWFAYQPEVHVLTELQPLPSVDLWLSFDFNVCPMTAVWGQVVGNDIRILGELYTLERLRLEEFTDEVLRRLPSGHRLIVTGDPSGRQGHVLGQPNSFAFKILENRIVPTGRLRRWDVLPVAPAHTNSFHFCNAMLGQYTFRVWAGCRELLLDLDDTLFIDNQLRNPDPHRGHLGDALRYLLHTALKHVAHDIGKYLHTSG